MVKLTSQYVHSQISANVRRRKDFLRLPSEDQNLLEKVGWKKKLDDVDAAIQANARFLQHIIMHPEIFEVRADLKDKVNDDEPTADGTRHSRYSESWQSYLAVANHLTSHFQTFRMPLMRQMDVERHPAYLTVIATAMTTQVHTTRMITLVLLGLIGRDIAPRNLIWTSYEAPSDNLSEIGAKRYLQNASGNLISFANDGQGKPERDACYLPMTNALLEHFSGVPPEARSVFGII